MLLIKNAKIYTMNSDVIEKGDILVENGKIKEIKADIYALEKETDGLLEQIVGGGK